MTRQQLAQLSKAERIAIILQQQARILQQSGFPICLYSTDTFFGPVINSFSCWRRKRKNQEFIALPELTGEQLNHS